MPLPPSSPEYDPNQRVDPSLTVTQPGEVTLFSIKRHPVGIILVYAAAAAALLVLGILSFAVGPALLGADNGNQTVSAVLFLFLTLIGMIYTFVATIVYWGNRWIVTTDSITQLNQTTPFHRESAQLALVNIENVTAEKNGILPHVFNFGTIKAETAGRHGKFVFPYCPNPNYYAQRILAAREALGPVKVHGQVNQ